MDYNQIKDELKIILIQYEKRRKRVSEVVGLFHVALSFHQHSSHLQVPLLSCTHHSCVPILTEQNKKRNRNEYGKRELLSYVVGDVDLSPSVQQKEGSLGVVLKSTEHEG